MPISIPVPNVGYGSNDITLAGINYTFVYMYNERDNNGLGRWRVSLYQDEVIIIAGMKIVEHAALIKRYRLPEFDHGELYCIRVLDDGQPAGLSNFGIDKAYEFRYFTNDELEG